MTVDERIDPHLFDELRRAVTLALVGWLALAVLAVVLVALDARRAGRRARFRARHDIPRMILTSSSDERARRDPAAPPKDPHQRPRCRRTRWRPQL